MSKTPEQRFWEKVKIGKPDECWLWIAAIDTNGYGAVKHLGKKRNSHRIAYELSYGPVDRNMDIMHSCDVRLCCNPRHLSPGTRLENVHDALNKGRHASGEQSPNAKLSNYLVLAIRILHREVGYNSTEIGSMLGVEESTVRHILKRRTWKHVKSPSEVA